MSKSGAVKVYAFNIYDIGTDEMRRSRRMATREAIAAVGGVTIEGSELEIDAGLVGKEVPGMTERNVRPQGPTAFQSRVRPD